jgi:tetratricopeptide (TPR) repeat protein
MQKIIVMIALALAFPALPARTANLRADIFPGECPPEISDAILRAYNFALNRKYEDARRICEQLERDYPDHPSGSTGLMVLYQVMMLENDDYAFDHQLKAAAERNQTAVNKYLKTAPKNSWYYTLVGTSWGIQGIYYLRQDQYLLGFYRGYNGLRYLRAALKINPDDWEARLGLGVFLYYSSAYTSYLPIFFPDRRSEGIREVEQAGEHRPYLSEVSRIALYYIYLNEHDFDRSLSVMQKLLAERPEFVVYYQFAGRALAQKGDYRAALSCYRRIQELDPALYLPLFKLGECYFKLGEYPEAKTYLEKFLGQAKNPAPQYVTATKSYLARIQERSHRNK